MLIVLTSLILIDVLTTDAAVTTATRLQCDRRVTPCDSRSTTELA